jgi:hypothetical protein
VETWIPVTRSAAWGENMGHQGHRFTSEEARVAGTKAHRRKGFTPEERARGHRFTKIEAFLAGQKGGRMAQARGTGHRWSKDEAVNHTKDGRAAAEAKRSPFGYEEES